MEAYYCKIITCCGDSVFSTFRGYILSREFQSTERNSQSIFKNQCAETIPSKSHRNKAVKSGQSKDIGPHEFEWFHSIQTFVLKLLSICTPLTFYLQTEKSSFFCFAKLLKNITKVFILIDSCEKHGKSVHIDRFLKMLCNPYDSNLFKMFFFFFSIRVAFNL